MTLRKKRPFSMVSFENLPIDDIIARRVLRANSRGGRVNLPKDFIGEDVIILKRVRKLLQ